MPSALRVIRIVEGLFGRVHVHSALRLRFDHGASIPWVHQVDGQIVGVCGRTADRRIRAALATRVRGVFYAPHPPTGRA
jgi:hypothetical protein